MKYLMILSLLAFSVVGCQTAPQSDSSVDAVTAEAPQLIDQLTNQTTIYACPTCHMEYDRAGQCAMCKVDLVETEVAYICPLDNDPVTQAGKCPRCAANARIEKTAMVPTPTEGPSEN